MKIILVLILTMVNGGTEVSVFSFDTRGACEYQAELIRENYKDNPRHRVVSSECHYAGEVHW